MARNFGSQAVAIGISSEADLRMIRNLGCDMGQGFLLGKPMDAQRIDALIASFKSQKTAWLYRLSAGRPRAASGSAFAPKSDV
jgi:predicted signal transduction protein with EAL and GGDEF domain